MQFFQYMKDIYLDSYEQFVEDIEKFRERYLKHNNDLTNTIPKSLDLGSVTCLPNGQFSTIIEGIKFNCFFHYKNEDYLYIFLNGARRSTREKASFFYRWSYYKFLNGSLLNIADPMLEIYPDLKLGWYYGNDNINIREILAKLVEKIAEMYAIKKKNIVFFGSSGGGTATFECANYIEGSKAVALNPQIILSEHGYSKTFTEVSGVNLYQDERWNRHNTILQLKNNEDIKYILIVNLRSEADIKQLQNICKEKKIRVKYGINVFKDLIVWVYDADVGIYKSPHKAQEYYCIWFLIQFLIENVHNKKYLIDNDSLFRLGSEFWYEHYDQQRRWMDKSCCMGKILGRIKGKKVVVFGTGSKADEISQQLLDIGGENHFNVQFALDNSLNKRGDDFQGLPILHPSDIESWENLYVIITSELYDKDIKIQLENLGLNEGKDFISYKDFYC